MNKKAISVTLSPENLLWLRARAVRNKNRSVSEALDELLLEIRASKASARSVVGMVTLPERDLELREASKDIRKQFEKSLSRPINTRPKRRGAGSR